MQTSSFSRETSSTRRQRPISASRLLIAGALFVSIAAAQNVPPPPRPIDAQPAKGSPSSFLRGTLSSLGRVNWSVTTRNTNTGEVTGPTEAFEEVTQFLINPGACEMKVQFKASPGDSGGTFFFEEFDSVEVKTAEEHNNTVHVGQGHAELVESISRMVYSVVIDGRTDFKVRDLLTANEVAGALRQEIQRCKAFPRVAAGKGPTLADTLGFIEDKLNQQGAVSWLDTVRDTVAGTSSAPTPMSIQVSRAAGDPGACRLSYQLTKTAAGKAAGEWAPTVNLHRVEKMEVTSLQDYNNHYISQNGHPELVESISPAPYALSVTGAAGRSSVLVFADEDLANRVAKALLHATELCGGGSKDPF